MTCQQLIDKYYPSDTLRRVIYLRHCEAVAQLALEIVENRSLNIDRRQVYEAAMLHDIGIVMTDAPDIGCHGDAPYICHGLLGSELIREAGLPEEYARVAERHTGAGITADDIQRQSLPLPPGDYMPETLLERLICYADKFYSKSGDMQRKPLPKVISSMLRISPDTLERFMKLHDEFSFTS